MKRVIALIVSAMLMVSMIAVSVSATTKADLLAEAAKSPIYHYVSVAVENAARTINITDEQAEQLLPIVKKAVAAVKTDRGPTYANENLFYTVEEHDIILECIDEACKILGFTWGFADAQDPKHPADRLFEVFDQNGKLVFYYDGDVVADTAAATTADTAVLFAGAAIMLALGAVAVAISKKRMSAE